MPLSPSYSLLFIHIPKCAGKSIEEAIGIATAQELDQFRARSKANLAFTYFQRRTADRKARNRLFGMIDCSVTAQHLTVAEIYLLGLVDSQMLDRLTKFAVCRNPFDRAVSTFHHMGAHCERTPAGFETFWREWPSSVPQNHNDLAHRRCQWEFVTDLRGENVMNCTLRFEFLHDDFKRFSDSFCGQSLKLPWRGRASSNPDYQYYYTEASKRLIQERFDRDFELFGYSTRLPDD